MNGHTSREAGFVVSRIWFAAEPPGPWINQAACRQHSPIAELFTDASTFAEADVALTICVDCPVRAACLAYGQGLHADGVWGGRLLHAGVAQQRRRRSAPPRDDDRQQPRAS